MNDNEILDDRFHEEKEVDILDAIGWWERKRWIYNVLLLGTEVLIMLLYIEGLIRFGVVIGIIQTIFVNVIANILYSIGWGLEALLIYYFKEAKFSDGFRNFLFYLGVAFTLLITALTYSDGLSNPSF